MGIVEAAITLLLLIGSIGYNVKQAGDIGELSSDRERYKAVADKCEKFNQATGDAEYRAATDKAKTEEEAEKAIIEYKQLMADSISGNSNPCLNTPIGPEYDGVLDDERRLMEKLRESRMQTEP